MNPRLLAPALLAAILVLGGCASSPSAPAPTTSAAVPTAAAPSASDALGAPGATLDPSVVTDPAPDGQRIALVVGPGSGEEENRILTQAEEFVTSHGGSVTVHAGLSAPDSIIAALAEHPDVVVGVGPSVVGAVDHASASNLDQSFLVLGTQLAEPTGNVVAVVWPGAEDRAVFADQQPSFAGAAEYGSTAVEVGLSSFASGLAGYVIALD